MLEETLVDDILKNSGLYKDKNTIFGFLKKFNLAVEVFTDIKFIDEDDSYITLTNGRVYLVPSMLHYNETKQYTKQKQDIVILDKFVSDSIFNQMLVKTVIWCRENGHYIQRYDIKLCSYVLTFDEYYYSFFCIRFSLVYCDEFYCF